MKRRLQIAASHVIDNAMLYKDVTQWLRNKTFLVLFFGLLMAAEAVSLFIMALGEEVERPGSTVFNVLYFVLIFFGLVVAFMGHSLTSREFQNRTFELYELSGMSLERMIGGKLLSMVYQFFFGFCCVVPFMFVSYFLGSLDFLDIMSGLLLAAVAVVPTYLIALLSALTTRLRQISTLGKIGAIGLLLFFGFMVLVSMFNRHSVGNWLFSETTAILKLVLAGERDVITSLSAFFLGYVQVCLLLFYLCCHMIARETDSRELQIRVLCVTLTLSWLGFVGYMTMIHSYDKEVPDVAFIPTYILLCFLSLMMFFNQMRVPAIVQSRYRNAKGIRRFLYYWLEPGPRGYYRFFLALVIFFLAYAAFMHGAMVVGLMPTSSHMAYAEMLSTSAVGWARAASYILQVAFFVAFPIGFLSAFFPKVRENVAVQRTLVACWWGFAGAVVSFYAIWSRMYRTSYRDPLDVLSSFVSPISSLIVNTDNASVLNDTFGSLLRTGMGILGIYLMHGILRRRARTEAALELQGSTSSAYADTGAPA